ncbi:MAG: anti-sigma factor domain-containing protein, partial [Acidimicrobiales bacterium]
TSLLSYSGGEASPELWDRIVSGMQEAPPAGGYERIRAGLGPDAGAVAPEPAEGPPTATGVPAPAGVPPAGVPPTGVPPTGVPPAGVPPAGRLPSRRRPADRLPGAGSRRPVRWRAAVALLAAAAVTAIAVLGIQVANLDGPLSRSRQVAAAAPATMSDVRAALAVPGHRSATLLGPDSRLQVVILPDGVGYVYAPRLHPLPPSRTYQLWGVVGGQAISYGLLGPRPGVEEFRAGAGVQALAVTDETASGVVVSHQPFTVSGSLAAI